GYTVTSSPGEFTEECESSPCTVAGLTNGTSYTFTVHATNVVGDSAESDPSSAVTPQGAPGAPTEVSATAGPTSARGSGPPRVAGGGSPVRGYTVTATDVTDAGNGGQTADADADATSAMVTGLTRGDTYRFTVHATNDIGDSAESDASNDALAATVP